MQGELEMRVFWAFLLGAGMLLIFGPRAAGRPRELSESTKHFDARHLAISLGAGVFGAAIALVIVGVPMVALLAGTLSGSAPTWVRKASRNRLLESTRSAWPEAIEMLAGAVRAGETLIAAINVVATRGPEALRPVFDAVVSDQRVSGDLQGALNRVLIPLADTTADQVLATLGLIHRVGGREAGRVLRTFAGFLRDDLALRREVQARQSWTKVAARVAIASPWLVVLLVSARPEGRAAYSTGGGAVMLLVGAVVTIIGYRVMVMTGRIAEPKRVGIRTESPEMVAAA